MVVVKTVLVEIILFTVQRVAEQSIMVFRKAVRALSRIYDGMGVATWHTGIYIHNITAIL